MKKLIETYKGIDIYFYSEDSSLRFGFEGLERKSKYLFEAEAIIDEPRWEDCDLRGYWVDGVFRNYIGTAIATRKDIKSGVPQWQLKGEYDTNYKTPDSWRETKVFLKNETTDKVYVEWKIQNNKVLSEERRLREIIEQLNPL